MQNVGYKILNGSYLLSVTILGHFGSLDYSQFSLRWTPSCPKRFNVVNPTENVLRYPQKVSVLMSCPSYGGVR